MLDKNIKKSLNQRKYFLCYLLITLIPFLLLLLRLLDFYVLTYKLFFVDFTCCVAALLADRFLCWRGEIVIGIDTLLG